MADEKYPIPVEGEPPVRYHLPDERPSRTVKIIIGGELIGYLTVGFFKDGSPAEIFIKLNKTDEKFSGFAEMWAIAISMLFQYGVPHQKIYDKFSFQDFPPHGFTNLSDTPSCKSLADLIVRYLQRNFPPTKKEDQDEYDIMVEDL